MSEFVNDSNALKEILKPFLHHDLASWKGLPKTTVQTLIAALGEPVETVESMLGWYPADRYTLKIDAPAGGLVAYARNREVVLIEAVVPPSLSAMETLGEPTAILPNEVLEPDAYVHEYLYCERGLILSVAEPFDNKAPLRIVRVRGVRPLGSPEEFGPEFYMAFQDRTVWQE